LPARAKNFADRLENSEVKVGKNDSIYLGGGEEGNV